LLLLAKIENHQFADIEELEVTAIINETLDLLSDFATTKQQIVFTNLTGKLTLTCNKTLLEILISNLLINAIVHSPEGGKISVVQSHKTVTISNTGITTLDSNKIFKRFVVSSAENSSSGLGLAIVKEICHRYGWTINYNFNDQNHVFELAFNIKH
jgi:signal transduction histidine kinase